MFLYWIFYFRPLNKNLGKNRQEIIMNFKMELMYIQNMIYKVHLKAPGFQLPRRQGCLPTPDRFCW